MDREIVHYLFDRGWRRSLTLNAPKHSGEIMRSVQMFSVHVSVIGQIRLWETLDNMSGSEDELHEKTCSVEKQTKEFCFPKHTIFDKQIIMQKEPRSKQESYWKMSGPKTAASAPMFQFSC